MIISHSKQFVFVHIYKTGGTSIRNCLIKYGTMRQRIFHEFKPTRKLILLLNRTVLNHRWSDEDFKTFLGIHNHALAREIKEYMGEELFNQYFTFSVVRNPWDWQLSLYFFSKRINWNTKYYESSNKFNFKDYLKFHLDNQPPLLLDFVTDLEGNIIVDKICKVENIDQDFKEILEKLGMDSSKIVVPQKNVSSNRERDYRIKYDQESADLVGDYFQKDVDYFKYSFE